MRAVVLKAPGILELDSVPKPVCEKDTLLIRVITACICNGSDPTIARDRNRKDFPIVFGHEAYGEIVEIGDEVSGFTIGERISWWFTLGAFGEYVLVRPKEVAIVRLSETVPREEAPVFELVIAASRAVYAAEVKGKRIVIQGLGPSGLIMAQLFRSLGAEEVMGVDLYENRKKLGVKYGCASLRRDCEYDVLVDAFGDERKEEGVTLRDTLAGLKFGGELILYGQPAHGRRIDYRILQDKQVKVKVPTNDIAAIREMADKSLSCYREGRLSLRELVTDVIRLQDVPMALKQVEEQPDRHIKMIVDIERS